MADSLGKLTRTVKKYYEQISGQLPGGKIGIDQFLFGIDDKDLSAQFSIDQFIKEPYGVSFRRAGESSHVRAFENGVGRVLEVPRMSDKTPITEKEKDEILAGFEDTAGVQEISAERVNKIIRIHNSAFYQTRCKYAIDVMRTGKFTPLGEGGKDIALEVDYGRAAANSITYNFTTTGNNQDKALVAMYNLFMDKNGNDEDICVLMGSTWAADFQGDTDVQKWITANTANQILAQSMMPPILKNVHGLKVVATYRPAGALASMNMCVYNPGYKFTAYEGASAVPFVPVNEAIMFNPGAPRYRVFRGVDVNGDGGKVQRAVGEVVFDSFTDKDPIVEYIRAQSRIAFVPANVDHTVRCVGTFS